MAPTEGSGSGASGGRARPTKFQEKRNFSKENTVLVDVEDNSAVKAKRIIEVVTELCGEGVILACVPKSGNLYEVTLEGRSPINILIDGITVDGKTFDCKEVIQKFTLVSFLHLAAYVLMRKSN